MIDKFLAETGTAQQNPIAATFLLYAKISSSIDTHALPLSPSNSRTAQPLPYSHELIQALYYVALGLDPNWLQLVAKECLFITFCTLLSSSSSCLTLSFNISLYVIL